MFQYFEIVNNNTTFNPNLPWSAYRGKDMNEKIYDLNETFITDDEFLRLFEDIKYIYAEFKTSSDDETIGIFIIISPNTILTIRTIIKRRKLI